MFEGISIGGNTITTGLNRPHPPHMQTPDAALFDANANHARSAAAAEKYRDQLWSGEESFSTLYDIVHSIGSTLFAQAMSLCAWWTSILIRSREELPHLLLPGTRGLLPSLSEEIVSLQFLLQMVQPLLQKQHGGPQLANDAAFLPEPSIVIPTEVPPQAKDLGDHINPATIILAFVRMLLGCKSEERRGLIAFCVGLLEKIPHQEAHASYAKRGEWAELLKLFPVAADISAESDGSL
ncbi:hypothetical protein DXG01_012989, partial [Tephrocybe rancida]